MANETNPQDHRSVRAKWLSATMTRRELLPAFMVVIAGLVLATWLDVQQRSDFQEAQLDFQEAQIETAIELERQRCDTAARRIAGLRAVLTELYDGNDFLFDQIEAEFDIGDALVAARRRNDIGKAELDIRYPPRSVEDCLLLGATEE